MSPLVATHAFAACVGLLLGAWQLFGPGQGSPAHRVAGRVWVAALLYVAISSFWIREIRDGRFSLLHVLSVVTIVTVTLGLLAARRGSIATHRANMTGSWLGLVGAGIAASAVPQRALPELVVHQPGQAVLAALAVLATTAVVVALGSLLTRPAARTGSPAAGSGRPDGPARPTAPRPPRGSRRSRAG